MRKLFCILILALTSTLAYAQRPDQIELPCPPGSSPTWMGQSYDQATGKYRQWQCVQQDGTVTQAITDSGNGGQVYNVKAYGAKGDGTTNDSPAFQSAYNAAAAANAGTGRLGDRFNHQHARSHDYGRRNRRSEGHLRRHELGCGVPMKTICIALMLCAHGHFKPLNAAVLAASEFDATTTYQALNECPRCYEANPILNPLATTPAIFPVLGGAAWEVNWVANKLRKRGHGKWAKGLQLIVIGLHTFAGVHNLQVSEGR